MEVKTYLDVGVHNSIVDLFAVLLDNLGLIFVFETKSEIFDNLRLLLLLRLIRHFRAFSASFSSHFLIKL